MDRSRPPWRFVERASSVSFPNDPSKAHDMRAFVAGFLEHVEVPEDPADEILMAVGEVVANACRHGRRPTRPGEVDVTVEITGAVVCVAMVDAGPGFEVDAVLQSSVPDLLSPGGRGFFLMRQLMDDVEVDSSPRGTKVVLRRDLSR